MPPDSLGRENTKRGKNIPSLRLPALSPEIYAQDQVDTTLKMTALAPTPREHAIARDMDDQTQHGTPAEHFQRHQSRMSPIKERTAAPRRRHHHRRRKHPPRKRLSSLTLLRRTPASHQHHFVLRLSRARSRRRLGIHATALRRSGTWTSRCSRCQYKRLTTALRRTRATRLHLNPCSTRHRQEYQPVRTCS